MPPRLRFFYGNDIVARAWPDAGRAGGRSAFAIDVLIIVAAWVVLNLTFLQHKVYIPWDSTAVFFPQTQFVVESIRHGQAPWWNPLIYGGQPALGDPQSMIFTPQVLVGLIAGDHFNQYMFDVTSLVAELCGGMAMARYASSYADSRTLPILGALVFMAGGVATSRLQHVPQIFSYSLLPLQLLALRGVCIRPGVARAAILAIVLTAGALNPNQITFLSAFALLPFVALHLSESRRRAAAFSALAGAGAFCAFAILPVYSAIREFAELSNRPVTDIAASSASSFPSINLASIFLPGLYGVQSPEAGAWPPTDLTQDFLYVGIIPAAVLLSSVVWPRRVRPITVLCWCGIIVSFIMAMGTKTPLYPFLFHHVPGFSAFRRPADNAYFLNLFIALLVASCRLPDRARFGPWTLNLVVATALLIGGSMLLMHLSLYAARLGHAGDLLIVLRAFSWRMAVIVTLVVILNRLDRGIVAWLTAPLAIGLTVADLAFAGRDGFVFGAELRGSEIGQVYAGNLSQTAPTSPITETISFLQQKIRTGPTPPFRVEVLGGSLAADMPMAFGIPSTQGYNPLRLKSYDIAIGGQNLQNDAKQFTPVSPGYDSADYRRLGLRYVLLNRYIVSHTRDFGAFGAAVANIIAAFKSGDWATPVPAPGAYDVWELRNAMPRAMLIEADGTERPCDIVSYRTVYVSVTCHAATAGRLVLGDTYAPGWRACVNATPARVEPFNFLFRSVAVPQGGIRALFFYQAVPFLRRDIHCAAS